MRKRFILVVAITLALAGQLGVICCFPYLTRAAQPPYVSTADVTVTATGMIVAMPNGLTLTYISDMEIGISWTKPAGAVNTMIRVALGHTPTSVTDGYEVYYGNGTYASDTAINLAAPDNFYYAAWSETAGGWFSPLSATADTGGFMSASFVFIGIIALGLGLTISGFAFRQPGLTVLAGLVWVALTVFMFTYSTGNDVYRILAYLGIGMSFLCFLGTGFLMRRSKDEAIEDAIEARDELSDTFDDYDNTSKTLARYRKLRQLRARR